MIVALCVILLHTAATILLGWGYFRRYAVTRPPIGVFNIWDVMVMMGGIILVPYLYLLLPIWLVAIRERNTMKTLRRMIRNFPRAP